MHEFGSFLPTYDYIFLVSKSIRFLIKTLRLVLASLFLFILPFTVQITTGIISRFLK